MSCQSHARRLLGPSTVAPFLGCRSQHTMTTPTGCFCKLGVLVVGVLIMQALLRRVLLQGFWKLPYVMYHIPYTIYSISCIVCTYMYTRMICIYIYKCIRVRGCIGSSRGASAESFQQEVIRRQFDGIRAHRREARAAGKLQSGAKRTT